MTCRDYQTRIQEFLDGELPDERVDELQAHCMHCPDCAQYLRRMNELHQKLGLLETEPVPQGLHRGIMEAVHREKKKSPVIRFMSRPAAAVAAAVVLLVGTVTAVSTIGGRSSEAVALTEDTAEAVETAAAAAGALKSTAVSAGPNEEAGQYASSDTQMVEAALGTAAETVSGETAQERARARASIPEVTVGRAYAFVQVIRTETVPQTFTDWTAQDVRFNDEDVTVLVGYATRTRAEAIRESAEADWTYFCDDPDVWTELTTGAGEGLVLVIVPRGA